MIFIPIAIGFILATIWLIYELCTAPAMDENGNILDENG